MWNSVAGGVAGGAVGPTATGLAGTAAGAGFSELLHPRDTTRNSERYFTSIAQRTAAAGPGQDCTPLECAIFDDDAVLEDDDAEFPATLALPGTAGCQIEARPDEHAELECRAFASNGTAAGVDAGAAAYSAEGEKLAHCLPKDRFDMKDTAPNEVTFVSHSYYGPSVRIRGKMSEHSGQKVVEIFVAVIAADTMPEKPSND